jgi:hypothetical protein
VEFAELHRFAGVEVTGRPEHGKQAALVAFHLGALMGGNGVLDGQFVEAELGCYRSHLLRGGPVEPDPRHPAVPRHGLEGLFQAFRLGMAHAVDVHGVIDDGHSGNPSGRRTRRCSGR